MRVRVGASEKLRRTPSPHLHLGIPAWGCVWPTGVRSPAQPARPDALHLRGCRTGSLDCSLPAYPQAGFSRPLYRARKEGACVPLHAAQKPGRLGAASLQATRSLWKCLFPRCGRLRLRFLWAAARGHLPAARPFARSRPSRCMLGVGGPWWAPRLGSRRGASSLRPGGCGAVGSS